MHGSGLRLVVYGIDSADWRMMKPLLDAGEMPNLARLLEGGAGTTLISTIPPITAVAWPTAFTGTNPAKHGIFGFVLDARSPRVLSNADRQRYALWEILSRHGLRVGCFLVPFTYPPDEISGWMLCGMGEHGWRERSVTPTSLYDELKPILDEYPLAMLRADRRREPERLLQGWRRLAEWRRRLLVHLLDRHPVDVLIAVDNAVDVLQHKFLVTRELAGEDMVRWAYRHADAMLGLMMERAGRDTRFLVLSDHGAQPVAGYFDLGAWLCQRGYLRYRTASPLAFVRRGVLRAGARVLRSITWRWRGARSVFRLDRFGRTLRARGLFDWKHTRAFPWPGGGVVINCEGRSANPTVSAAGREALAREIKRELEELTNPLSGENDIRVFLREELYEGPELESAPDLFVVPQDFALDLVNTAPRFDRVFWTAEELREAGLGGLIVREGTHRREGICIVAGEGVGEVAEAVDISCVAPTALALLGLPIPDDMDGQSLVGGERVTQGPAEVQRGAGPTPYSEEEEQEIAQRLADLGYL